MMLHLATHIVFYLIGCLFTMYMGNFYSIYFYIVKYKITESELNEYLSNLNVLLRTLYAGEVRKKYPLLVKYSTARPGDRHHKCQQLLINKWLYYVPPLIFIVGFIFDTLKYLNSPLIVIPNIISTGMYLITLVASLSFGKGLETIYHERKQRQPVSKKR